MIRIERKANTIPVILTTKGVAETQKVLTFYPKGKKKANAKITYKAYSDETVKATLEKMFNGKCAYCESRVNVGMFGDIEHYRPKQKVTLSSGSINGYYWLGADWDNLLYSCELCNRKKKYPAAEKKKFISLGKQNQFPISNEAYRCKNHLGNLQRENKYRLLLNPCMDDPAKHLVFDAEGLVYPVVKKGKESEMGKQTIHVVALQRHELVTNRKRHFLQRIKLNVQELDEFYRKYTEAKASHQTARMKEYEGYVRGRVKALKALLEPEEEYLALTRQLLRPVFKKYGINIKI